ncbi:hypothetical protein Dsin_013941 [Dipteronia sinensis]|uniref:Uncharacterized protein n=1 Tax=Dipteronia sinensis TaxID=43782 RepID=A0AAE0AKT6_9ROSI|nr:hypothetical protein Dsin_013941 [Dipteronia sinensis]
MSLFRLPKGLIADLHRLSARFWWGTGTDKRNLHWGSWRKLCCSKNGGGLGFRDLTIFNKVLLAKQVWRLIHQPNTLAGKVLKQRYFPDSSVMEVSCGNSSSFLWKSLMWGREIIEVGARWRIGSGSSVRIYKDRWIPKPSSFMVVSPASLDPNATVDTLKTQSGAWNERLIRDNFVLDDAKAILSIPCSSSIATDSIFWSYEKFGSYTVKSGYHLGYSMLSSPGSSGLSLSESWWKSLWRIQVPAKVKLFLWRASHNWIPTNSNLAKRGVLMDSLCLICRRRSESTMHSLWCCPALKAIRAGCPFMRGIKFLRDFRNANSGGNSSAGGSNIVVPSWRPPDCGTLKINRDAAVDSMTGKIGIGVIIRDSRGEVLASSAQTISASLSASTAEALAVFSCLIFARDSGLSPVIIESDAQVVVNLINSGNIPLSDIGLIIHDINQVLRNFPSCRVSFVSRLANMAAHSLAKYGLLIASDLFWLEEFPSCVAPAVMGDRPSLL